MGTDEDMCEEAMKPTLSSQMGVGPTIADFSTILSRGLVRPKYGDSMLSCSGGAGALGFCAQHASRQARRKDVRAHQCSPCLQPDLGASDSCVCGDGSGAKVDIALGIVDVVKVIALVAEQPVLSRQSAFGRAEDQVVKVAIGLDSLCGRGGPGILGGIRTCPSCHAKRT